MDLSIVTILNLNKDISKFLISHVILGSSFPSVAHRSFRQTQVNGTVVGLLSCKHKSHRRESGSPDSMALFSSQQALLCGLLVTCPDDPLRYLEQMIKIIIKNGLENLLW